MIEPTNNSNDDHYDDINKELYEILVPNNHVVAVYVFRPISKPLETLNGNIYFIHGVGGCTNVWKHQIKHFALKFWKIISIDLLGHGKSGRLKLDKEYYFQQLVIDALYVFDRFVSDIQNVIVGHSYGCSIATYLAHERKDHISRLVLISGGSPTPLGSPPWLFYMCSCFLSCLHNFIIQEFRNRAFNKSELSKFTKQDTLSSMSIDSSTLKAVMFGQIWDEGGEEFHSQIKIPTLLIHGCKDKFVTCEEEYEMLSVLPTSTYRAVEEAGHMVMLEAPDLINRFIEDHILQNWEFTSSLPQDQISKNASNIDNNILDQSSSASKSNKKMLPAILPNFNNSKGTLSKNKIYPIKT